MTNITVFACDFVDFDDDPGLQVNLYIVFFLPANL